MVWPRWEALEMDPLMHPAVFLSSASCHRLPVSSSGLRVNGNRNSQKQIDLAAELFGPFQMRQLVEGAVDEAAFVVIEEGTGDLDVFSDDDFAGDIRAELQFIAG